MQGNLSEKDIQNRLYTLGLDQQVDELFEEGELDEEEHAKKQDEYLEKYDDDYYYGQLYEPGMPVQIDEPLIFPMSEYQAAQNIQRIIRGRQVRKKRNKLTRRMHGGDKRTRRKRKRMRAKKLKKQREAALQIQKMTRGIQSRAQSRARERMMTINEPFPYDLEKRIIKESIHGVNIDELTEKAKDLEDILKTKEDEYDDLGYEIEKESGITGKYRLGNKFLDESLRENYSEDDSEEKKRKKEYIDYFFDIIDAEQDLKRYIEIYETKLRNINKELYDAKTLDIFKCKIVKKIADADKRLYLDPEFLENYIRPCRYQLANI